VSELDLWNTNDEPGWNPWGDPDPGERTPAPRLTEPTVKRDTLGETIVYPDDHSGVLPPGGVRDSDHKKMLGIMNRISNGTSSLTINTDNFLKDKDIFEHPFGYMQAMIDAEKFRDTYLGHMKELVKTGPGLELLSELDASRHKTTITKGLENETKDDSDANSLLRPDGTRNVGTNTTISINPNIKSYVEPGQREQPWMTERDKFGFFHELVHSYHDTRGDTVPGDHKNVKNWEFQTLGLGPWANNRVSDNSIRTALGKDKRPDYGGVTY